MVHRRFFNVFLCGLWEGLITDARTVINTYKDYGCKESLGQVQTDYVAYNGDCLALPKGAHSVMPIHVDSACGGAYNNSCESL